MTKTKTFEARLIDVGRNKVNKTIYFHTPAGLHKEIKKHIASPGWGLELIEQKADCDTYEVTAGWRCVGKVEVKEINL